MKQIKLKTIPEQDLNKVIKFIDIADFVKVLKQKIDNYISYLYRDITFDTTNKMTIKEIKEFYKFE